MFSNAQAKSLGIYIGTMIGLFIIMFIGMVIFDKIVNGDDSVFSYTNKTTKPQNIYKPYNKTYNIKKNR